MTIVIEPAIASDVTVIHKYIELLEGTSLDFTTFKNIFITNCTQPNIIYLVARINNQVVGFISVHSQLLLHHAGYVYEIQEFFVHEKYRKQGVGSALINYIFRQLQDKQVTAIEVTANTIREDAHNFYTKHGFNKTHFKFVKMTV